MILNFFFKFRLFQLFFYVIHLITRLDNKKLQSHHEKYFDLFLCVGWGFFTSLYRSHFISLSLSLFVDAALQLLLCGVMSSSLILINYEL